MNPRVNWGLFVLAVAMGAFVYLADRKPSASVRGGGGATATFEPVDASLVGAVEVLRSNTVVRVELTNGAWRMALPVAYPGQAASVQRFLSEAAALVPSSWITAQEVAAQPEGLKAFGLEPAHATVTFHASTGPVILRVGDVAPGGHRFYLQRVGTDGVFLAPTNFLSVLPTDGSEWRDRVLMDLGGKAADRVSLSARGKIVFEATKEGRRWSLRQPLTARADGERIEALLAHLATVVATGFVTDAPVIDRAAYGLQPPEAELAVGAGGMELARLQVGAAPTRAADQRFVRRLAHTNVVTVMAEDLSILARPMVEFRDPFVFGTLPEVDRVELRGTNGFVLGREGTNWLVLAPRRFVAERAAVDLLLSSVSQLEVAEFVNDVVADLAPYGLHAPSRELVASRGTNTVAHLMVGKVANPVGTLLYARRADESSVYAVPRTILFNLESPGQLRAWKFASTQVVSVAVLRAGRSLAWARDGAAWKLASGTVPGAVPDAVEEALHRLGQWDSMRYVVTDEVAVSRSARLAEVDHEVRLALAGGAPVRSLRLRFGAAMGATRIVLAWFDDDPVPLRLEMPEELHGTMARFLGMP